MRPPLLSLGFFLGFLLAALPCSAQHLHWVRTVYDAPARGLAAATDAAGNAYAAGSFHSHSVIGEGAAADTLVGWGTNVLLASYDTRGQLRWARTGASRGTDGARALAVGGSHVFVGGCVQGEAAFSTEGEDALLEAERGRGAFVARYDTSGAFHWAATVGSYCTEGLAPTAEGGAVVVGSKDYLAARLDAEGREQWRLEGPPGSAVAVASDGAAYVAGVFRGRVTLGEGEAAVSLGREDFLTATPFLARVEPEGRLAWAQAAGAPRGGFAAGVAVTASGDVLLAGYNYGEATFGEATFGEGAGQARLEEATPLFLATYAPSGTLRSLHAARGEGRPKSLALGRDGSIIVAGQLGEEAGQETTFGEGEDALTLTARQDESVFVAAFEPDGRPRWARQIGSEDRDRVGAAAATPEGEVVVTGFFGEGRSGAPALFAAEPREVRLHGTATRNPESLHFDPTFFLARYGAEPVDTELLEQPIRLRPVASAAPGEPAAWRSRRFRITNPAGVYDFQDFESATFRQEVEARPDGSLVVTVSAPERLPRPAGAYPARPVAEGLRRYAAPSRHIQSEDEEIARLARRIEAAAGATTQAEMVEAVLAWSRGHLRWAHPDEVPDARTALERGTGNCIGFTHLPAALLRHLGIAARTVRTFMVFEDYGALVPHYLLEVYYPEADAWVLYEPQGPGVPSINNLALYRHHDWSVEGQRASRPFSRDPRTRVERL